MDGVEKSYAYINRGGFRPSSLLGVASIKYNQNGAIFAATDAGFDSLWDKNIISNFGGYSGTYLENMSYGMIINLRIGNGYHFQLVINFLNTINIKARAGLNGSWGSFADVQTVSQ